MRKLLIYFVFGLASFGLVILFVTSTTVAQLALASCIYPVFALAAFKLFPRKRHKTIVQSAQDNPRPINDIKTGTVDIVDIDKRAFLKLIGAAGFSLFIFSIFSRRAEALFFGKSGISALEDTEGNKISPAERQPTDGYQISEIDQTENTFYGFINKDGGWYIMKLDQDSGAIRYIRGESDFPRNWNKRAHFNYDYYHNVF